jgi:hypothetical protein
MASTIVSRTQSGAESAAGRRTWTFSCWFKRSGISSSQELFGSDSNGARSNNYNIIDLNSSDQIDFSGYESGTTFRKTTNRKFRDINAWYHLVIAFDTTQSTADDRIKMYINGVRETSFGTSTNPSQDHQGKFFASNKVHAFGRSSQTFDGVISHCHATEGTAYAPTVFGETDSTTGEWKIITNPSVSYGTNGFFLFKNDNAVTNQSGNSSGNFAVTAGTLTKTEDNPSNIFATWNPLNSNPGSTINFTNGNTHVSPASDSSYMYAGSTLAMPKKTGSKFYAEFLNYGVQGGLIGIGTMDTLDNAMRQNVDISNNATYTDFGRAVYRETGNGQIYYVTGEVNTNVTMSNNDIQQIAIDLENGKFYVGKNGTWTLSGDPANNSGGLDISSASWYTNNDLFCFVAGSYTGVGSGNYRANFGNGYFGTTAVSSAGTNASNNGIFEYDVPNGFTALSTKGLNL